MKKYDNDFPFICICVFIFLFLSIGFYTLFQSCTLYSLNYDEQTSVEVVGTVIGYDYIIEGEVTDVYFDAIPDIDFSCFDYIIVLNRWNNTYYVFDSFEQLDISPYWYCGRIVSISPRIDTKK